MPAFRCSNEISKCPAPLHMLLALVFDLMGKLNYMGDLLYVLAVILIIGWILGAFVFSVGGLIHILLVVAIVAILLRLIRGRSV
jgi:hypothetical protein